MKFTAQQLEYLENNIEMEGLEIIKVKDIIYGSIGDYVGGNVYGGVLGYVEGTVNSKER